MLAAIAWYYIVIITIAVILGVCAGIDSFIAFRKRRRDRRNGGYPY